MVNLHVRWPRRTILVFRRYSQLSAKFLPSISTCIAAISANVNLYTFHAQLLGTCASVMTSARSRANAGNDVSQLLLIVSDGRGIFLEGVEVSYNCLRLLDLLRALP